jgi:hypothetical protein
MNLIFGNDDACCSQPGDIAILKLFLGSELVGSNFVGLNRNDILDQSVSFDQIGGGLTFDRFEFSYAKANGAPINLIELVDNITFNTAVSAVPEPATWIMMLLGFGSIGFAVRRRRAATNTVSHNFA